MNSTNNNLKTNVVCISLYDTHNFKSIDTVKLIHMVCKLPKKTILDIFYTSQFKEICGFFGKIVVQKTPRNEFIGISIDDIQEYFRQDVVVPENIKSHIAYSYTNNNLGIVFICDKDYPQYVIRELCWGALKDIQTKSDPLTHTLLINDVKKYLHECLEKIQDPNNVSKIYKTKEEIEKTKKVLMKTIDDIIERGERIEDLVDKTNDLSMSSKLFMKNSRRLNSCFGWCTIL